MIVSPTGSVSTNHGGFPSVKRSDSQDTVNLDNVEIVNFTSSRSSAQARSLVLISTSSASLQQVEEGTLHREPRLTPTRDATICEKAKHIATHPAMQMATALAVALIVITALIPKESSDDSATGWGIMGGAASLIFIGYLCLGGPLQEARNLVLPIDGPENGISPTPPINNDQAQAVEEA